MIKESKLKGIFEDRAKKLYTINLVPGAVVYDEKLIREKNIEYRSFNPRKSKLAAALLKGLSQIGLKESYTVLYLGASSGTTVSHVSDIVGKGGFIFAVEFSLRTIRDLVFLAEKRKNIAPVFEDANNIQALSKRVSQVDFLYMDIAQKNQTQIFLNNCNLFLKPGGFALLCVKSRSIDIAKKPQVIYNEVRKELEKSLTIVDYKKLDPFEKDHCVFVVKKK